MTYEAWRISYQSSEQAARAAYAECVRLRARLEAAEKERDELLAKSAEMEKQEPVGRALLCVRCSTPFDGEHYCPACGHHTATEEAVYAIPGAQPAPSIPEGWKPIPEKHSTFGLVDLRLADGSVLCECAPQIDGDYWWRGPSGGDVFIDPRYAPVTHWRLAAAPEAKP